MALGKTWREIQELDCEEIAHWLARFRNDPFGDQREDMRSAVICQVIAAVVGNKKALKDFMLFPEKQPEKKHSPSAIMKAAKLVSGWFGRGHDNRNTKRDPVAQ